MANPTVTKCLIGEARMNFAHVFTPDSFDDKSEPKYSVVLSFPKSDKKLYATIEAAINECAEKAKAKHGGALPRKFSIIEIKDGEDWDPKYNLEDFYTIKATSSFKPEVVKKAKVMGKVQLVPITDEEEFYSGCYGYASVSFYEFGGDKSPNKGITCALNSVLKSRDGERLGEGGGSVETDYADVMNDIEDPFEDDDVI
jgi:hypothetical protein